MNQVLKNTIIVCAAIVWAAFIVCLAAYRSNANAAYEVKHNCKRDYNGLCYTQTERPHLFAKGGM